MPISCMCWVLEASNMLNEMSNTAYKSICWLLKFDAFLINVSENLRKK